MRNRAVRNAVDKVRSNLENSSTPVRVGIGVNSAGNQVVEVRIIKPSSDTTPSPGAEISTSLPDHVSAEVGRGKGKSPETFQNIPVKSTSISYEPLVCDEKQTWFYTDSYSEIPGGVAIDASDGDTIEAGTTATPVYNEGNGRYEMLTAGHVFEDNAGQVRNSVYQPCVPSGMDGSYVTHEYDNITYIKDYDGDGEEGSARYSVNTVDAGTFLPENSKSTDYSLADQNGGTDEIIGGYWSWEKIEQGVSFLEMHHQGSFSGDYTGVIEFADQQAKWFATDTGGNPGDSGGAVFSPNSSNNLNDVNIAGPISSRVDFDNDGEEDNSGTGTFALERILSELNLSFI